MQLEEEPPWQLHSTEIASPTRNVPHLIHSRHQLPENTQEGLRSSVAEFEDGRELEGLSPICLRRNCHRKVIVSEERLVELLVPDTQQRDILPFMAPPSTTSPVKLSVGRSATKIKRSVERYSTPSDFTLNLLVEDGIWVRSNF